MKKYLFLTLTVLILVTCQPKQKDSITIFAGVGMSDVVKKIAFAYTERTGVEMNLNLASSAILARQIEAGAPADVVVFASRNWADYVENKELVISKSRTTVAQNDIVLVAPISSQLNPFIIDEEVNLPSLISGKIAIGDPETVPAGKYCIQSMNYFGWTKELLGRFIYARDVRAALSYSEIHEVEASVVFASDAIKSQKVKILGVFPRKSHKPIEFISFKINEDQKTEKFYAFITSKQGLKIWEKHGFLPVE